MKYLETDRSFYKDVVTIAVPITLQNLITIGINMRDTIMLGALGETALSASALANQFINLFQICCMGIGMGAAVLTSRYWGARDRTSLKMAITVALRVCLLFASLFTLVSALAPRAILGFYTPQTEVIEAGATYLLWSLPTFFLGGLSLITTNIMRSVNLVRIPLVTSVCAFFVNVGANYVFIFGKGGMPRMGTAGAALGTTIARLFEFCAICGYFLLKDTSVGYRLRDLGLRCRAIVREYLRISVPVLVSDSLLGFGNNMVAMVMGHIGASFVSANAITTVVQQLSTVFIQGISFASAVLTGQTLGRGDVQAAKRRGYTFFLLGAVLGALAGGIILLISEPVIGAYNITPATREIARELMAAISIITLFQAMNSILTKGVLRGGGDTKFLMVADIFFLWAVSIPLGYFAGIVWQVPPFWIYFCLKIDQVLKAVWCIFRLNSGKWIKKISSAQAGG